MLRAAIPAELQQGLRQFQRLKSLQWHGLPDGLVDKLLVSKLNEQGVLTVAVPSAAIAQYLRMRELELVAGFDFQWGIAKLNVQVRPGLFPAPAVRKAPLKPTIDLDASQALQRQASSISDPELKQSLLSLAQRLSGEA